jgi:hypothetical protein
MPRRIEADKTGWLRRLPEIGPDEASTEQEYLERTTLSAAMLKLAGIGHESEYDACRDAAEHMLGAVSEPHELEEGW